MLNLLRAFRPLVGDFLSTIVFIVAVEILKDVRIAIVIGIASGIVQFAYLWLRGKPIAAMQWMSLFLVVTLGGASLLTADPRFVMAKPSIGGAAIGAVMLQRGWMLRYLPPRVTQHLSPAVPITFGYVWAGLQFVLATANLAVALRCGLAIWAWYTAIVPLAAQLGLFLLQYAVMYRLVRRSIRAGGGLQHEAA